MPSLPQTHAELIKVLLDEQDTEALVQYQYREIVDWLSEHPVASYERKVNSGE